MIDEAEVRSRRAASNPDNWRWDSRRTLLTTAPHLGFAGETHYLHQSQASARAALGSQGRQEDPCHSCGGM